MKSGKQVLITLLSTAVVTLFLTMALALVVADSSLPKPIKRLSYTLVHDRSKRHAVICLTFGVMCVATSLAVVSIITVHSEQNTSQKEPLLKEF